MKKFSIFIIILLLILIASLVFVLQNSAPVNLNFFTWKFSTNIGLLMIVVFFAGFIVMWLISIMFYIGSASRHRRDIKERDSLIKKLEEEKGSIKKEYEEKMKELDKKNREMEEKLKKIEELKKQVEPQTKTEEKKEEKKAEEKPTEENKESASEKPATEKSKRRGLFHRKK